MLASEPWTIDRITVERDDDSVTVDMNGWAFADPVLGPDAVGAFLMNGQPFAEVHFPVDRADVGAIFWQRPNARYCGFRCVSSGHYDDVYRDGVLEITYLNPGPQRLVPAQQSWYLCDANREGPFPDEDRRFRVIGNKDLNGFILTGLTDFKRLDAAANKLAGKGFAEYPRILDWGCGCGRLARYTARVPGVALTGCDIDADNVAWCAEHLEGRFVATTLSPPLPFADASFDLVYGVSVFTHLREPLQDAWLAELERVTAPGAVLLLTVHGRTALDYAALSPADYRTLEQRIVTRGLYVSSANNQIDGHAEHLGEYVNVFHDLSYLRERWGKRFDIIEILPGYIYTHDLVVMRRRG
ncbi:MAG: class I SAM-dependent methyltransferase [Betaproteobacteria bacterium]